jgi:hypothetical protein
VHYLVIPRTRPKPPAFPQQEPRVRFEANSTA